MNEACSQRDLAKSPKTMWLLWGGPTAVILVTGYASDGGWIMTIGWTLSLVVMGVACLVNARGCRRTHCYFTGPFFLVMAIVSLLHGLQIWSLGTHGWSYIGVALLLGGIVLCFIPERLWGEYRSS
jgi:predicted membrane channel-forming protein YqfA (hemolysin III family)